MVAEYITVHNTANDASAANEISYMIRNNNQISFHYAVDDSEIVQVIPVNRNAWHCGDGNGTGNRKSIGIEICYSKCGGDKYIRAEENAVQFIAKLLDEYGWSVDRVKQQHNWTSSKNCPHRIRDENRWESFLNRIEAAICEAPAESVPPGQSSQQPNQASAPQYKLQQSKSTIYRVYANGKWWSRISGYNDKDSNGYAGIYGKGLNRLRIK